MSLRMRCILSNVLLVIAVFFVYSVCLIAFADMGLAKYLMIVMFSIPVLGASLFGVKFSESRTLKESLGLVFMWGAITTLLVIFTFVCMLASLDIRNVSAANSVTFFSDYLAGTFVTVSFLLLGYYLQRLGDQKTTEQNAPKEATQRH